MPRKYKGRARRKGIRKTRRRGKSLNPMQRRAMTQITKKFTRVQDVVLTAGQGLARFTTSMIGAASPTNPGNTFCLNNVD